MEPKSEWTIKTTVSARRKFKEICSRRGVDFNDGLLYLIGLDTKEELGRNQLSFGVPGTQK